MVIIGAEKAKSLFMASNLGLRQQRRIGAHNATFRLYAEVLNKRYGGNPQGGAKEITKPIIREQMIMDSNMQDGSEDSPATGKFGGENNELRESLASLTTTVTDLQRLHKDQAKRQEQSNKLIASKIAEQMTPIKDAMNKNYETQRAAFGQSISNLKSYWANEEDKRESKRQKVEEKHRRLERERAELQDRQENKNYLLTRMVDVTQTLLLLMNHQDIQEVTQDKTHEQQPSSSATLTQQNTTNDGAKNVTPQKKTGPPSGGQL